MNTGPSQGVPRAVVAEGSKRRFARERIHPQVAAAAPTAKSHTGKPPSSEAA